MIKFVTITMLLKDEEYSALQGTGLIAKNPFKEHETIINVADVLWCAKPTNTNNPAGAIVKFRNGTGMDVKQTVPELLALFNGEDGPQVLN